MLVLYVKCNSYIVNIDVHWKQQSEQEKNCAFLRYHS